MSKLPVNPIFSKLSDLPRALARGNNNLNTSGVFPEGIRQLAETPI